MANQNQLIVEVVGDSRKLKAALNQSTADLRAFAQQRGSRIRTTVLDDTATQIQSLKVENEKLAAQAAVTQAAIDKQQASQARFAKGALIAGLAVNALGRNFGSLGGQIGKVGDALSQLSSGNIVGFVQKLRDQTQAISDFEKQLIKSRDAAAAMDEANKLDAAGFGQLANAARDAAAAIRATTDAFVDNTKIRDSTSPGAIASETSGLPLPKSRKPKPLTAEQRRAFFDAGIARELDRVQDLKTVQDQVAALRKIEAEIQNRIDVTKDITRKLNLEDQLVAVQRQERGIQAQAAADAAAERARSAAEAKRLAAERKRLADERRRRAELAQAAREARIQAAQFQAIGLSATGGDVVPFVDNLRKQLSQLSSRSDFGQVSNKLQTQLKGVRKVLSGELGKATVETRSKIQDLFNTIRDELNKGQQGTSRGNLTRTTSLNANRLLEGLGLGGDAERRLRARLSHFNSAGVALAGSGAASPDRGRDVRFTIAIDGRPVEHSVTKNQQKRARANPPTRRGK